MVHLCPHCDEEPRSLTHNGARSEPLAKVTNIPSNGAVAGRHLIQFADVPPADHTFFKLKDMQEEPVPHPFPANLGAINPQGLHKPVFNALHLAAMPGETCLAVTQAGDGILHIVQTSITLS